MELAQWFLGVSGGHFAVHHLLGSLKELDKREERSKNR
jgi:hypothetical protein